MGTSDRRPYLTASSLNQALLDECQDNLTNRLEMVAEIETPLGLIYVSDQAKYVGSTFYFPRVEFPTIVRSIGDWLGELEFPSLELKINNADGEYSNFMPGGADYDGWIGKDVTIKLGLAENASTYQTVFRGPITDVGGFQRDTMTFTLTARSDYDRVNVTIPNQSLIPEDFPDIEDDFVGLAAPIIYGDWTVDVGTYAKIPAFPVNTANANVIAGTDPVRVVISSVPLKSVQTGNVYLRRGDEFFTIPGGDVSIVGGSNNQILDIDQQGFSIEGSPWIYASGDEFFVRCEGVDLSGLDSNIVAQAKNLLMTFGGLVLGDFDATWTTYQNKNSPAQSAIASITSRVWIQEPVELIKQVKSMLDQVRLAPFINKSNMFSLSSLHFEDFDPSPSFAIKNWDVLLNTARFSIDERNNWNRAFAQYSFDPSKGELGFSTAFYRNDDAVTQAGKTISKRIDFPNLTKESDVVYQVTEMLRLAGGYCEFVEFQLTPRSLLLEIGDFINIDVNIGSVQFGTSSVVGLVREVGYNPDGSLNAKIWSLQMIHFPGYVAPTNAVGGYDRTVSKET